MRTDSWRVQTPASLRIKRVATLPTQVTQGQKGIEVVMTVENTGQATALVSGTSLTFTGTVDETANSGVTPYMGNPKEIPGET